MEPVSITANILSSLIEHSFPVSLWTKFVDVFRVEEEILIEWTSPEYRKIEILGGLVLFEQGERRTLRIRGKPGFIAEAIKYFSQQGTIRARKSLSRTRRGRMQSYPLAGPDSVKE